MKLHILGICGTFMGGVAQLAKALGHEVSGMDKGVYPPMSTQLESSGITLTEGYDQPLPAADCYIIGNALSRGNPAVETILREKLPYTSGPQWMHDHLLQGKHVLAVAGTHGKTTTSALLAWILDQAGLNPGFLIGGVAANFPVSALVTDSPYFVIEADEYDTAFFDKRSKFVHYQPSTLILNNLEFDHADIFPDLAAIERQFHHLVRTVPDNGRIVAPPNHTAIRRVLEQGCWTPLVTFATGEAADYVAQESGGTFELRHDEHTCSRAPFPMLGEHSLANTAAAVAAAHHVGVSPEQALKAVMSFKGVKRRMEFLGNVRDCRVFDDFAHHPTAIATTLAGVRAAYPDKRIAVALHPSSRTMQAGTQKSRLPEALALADEIVVYTEAVQWDATTLFSDSPAQVHVVDNAKTLHDTALQVCARNDILVLMSNGSFAKLPQKLKASAA